MMFGFFATVRPDARRVRVNMVHPRRVARKVRRLTIARIPISRSSASVRASMAPITGTDHRRGQERAQREHAQSGRWKKPGRDNRTGMENRNGLDSCGKSAFKRVPRGRSGWRGRLSARMPACPCLAPVVWTVMWRVATYSGWMAEGYAPRSGKTHAGQERAAPIRLFM